MKPKVAIVVPGTRRSVLTRSEELSLNQLNKHLKGYDKFFVCPKDSNANFPGLQNKKFPNKYFGSALRHSLMLFDEEFYKAFEDYEYIFFYHLDALVFKDELESWVSKNYDFIGAPWLPSEATPWVDKPMVGNGGFALLKVQSALRALETRKSLNIQYRRYDKFAITWFRINAFAKKLFSPDQLKKVPLINHTIAYENFIIRNDLFWGVCAPTIVDDFDVPEVDIAIKFAFETVPRRCLEINHGNLPFGCHAWERYDRDFWLEVFEQEKIIF